ncbi:universal stress protein [Parapedobacter defluvii]|uniref:universal stress protein n=1 Tax=Parapedobacter defluvii TaxID=2045106 RepID=UPI00333E6BDE
MATQFKRILCPFDFSDAAVNAATYAAHLAKDTDRELLLMYIHQEVLWQGIAPMDGGVFAYQNELAPEMPERMDVYVQSIRQSYGIRCGYVAKRHVEHLAVALSEEIEEGNPDLVVMGTGGATYGSLFSTNTYQVIRKTSRPLLMIPKELTFRPLRNIIYATDYCPNDFSHIKGLLKWTEPYSPRLTILHISKNDSRLSDELFSCFQDVLEDEFASRHTIRYKRVIGNDVPGLLHEAMEGSDLLVLLAKQYSFFEKLFHRSTIRKLSFIAGYPILIYPDKA